MELRVRSQCEGGAVNWLPTPPEIKLLSLLLYYQKQESICKGIASNQKLTVSFEVDRPRRLPEASNPSL